MLGRIGWRLPPFIISRPGSWLGTSVCIDRTTHRSSASLAMFGNSSLMTTPFLPCALNANGDGTNPALTARSALGGFCPAYF